MAYLFRIASVLFILNVQYSTCGNYYPRLFCCFPDGSYLNTDFTLGASFRMSEAKWISWFDDDLVRLDLIEQVHAAAKDAGLNPDRFVFYCNQLVEFSNKHLTDAA